MNEIKVYTNPDLSLKVEGCSSNKSNTSLTYTDPKHSKKAKESIKTKPEIVDLMPIKISVQNRNIHVAPSNDDKTDKICKKYLSQ